MTAASNPPPADFERIVPRRPAGLSPAPSSSRPAAESPSRVSASSFWIAMIALLGFAIVAFWLLPRWFAAPAPVAATSAPPIAATSTAIPAAPDAPTRAPAPSTTPAAWDNPALLAARAAAQDARQRYTEQREQLRAQGIERWGASALAAAESDAAAGADAFTAKDFATARSRYESAAAATDALAAQIPQRLEQALAAGNQALDAGDKTAAQTAFELAQALDPANAQAQRGLARVANFDAVRAKLDTARRLEQAGDIAGARKAWNEALALDAQTQLARDALARLDAQSADDAFRKAMGEALAALDRGAYDEAERALGRASALRAQDPAVRQASARLAEARRGQKLAALEREATAQIAAENWAAAVASYRAALQLDATVAYARDGLVQAEPRAALAERLQDYATRRERLTSSAVASEASSVLAQARAVPAAGPRLLAQIAALERALADATTPIAVQLQSDGQTEVTVYKVGTLGRFSTHALSLRPGRYVAVGSRVGYQDVREEFEVAAGAQNVRVEIRCEDPL